MEQLLDQIRTWRRHLHAIPEIGFQEYKTSKYLYEELKKINIFFKNFSKIRCSLIKKSHIIIGYKNVT